MQRGLLALLPELQRLASRPGSRALALGGGVVTAYLYEQLAAEVWVPARPPDLS